MKEIQLTQGYTTQVDDEDFDNLNQYNWHVLNGHPRHRYAARWIPGTKPRKVARMHHVVLSIHPAQLEENNLVVDHIDRNGLNNCKENLRIVTRSMNALNSDANDAALGVYWDNYRGSYKAVQLPGRQFIGWYKTFEEAIAAKEALCE